MSFTLPDLPYAYDALAPYMSRETLEYHHDKHHLAYVNNGNNLLKGTEWEGKSLEDVVKGTFRQESGPLQQCRPALQPHSFLEMDEAERRRRQDSRQSREEDRRRSRLGREDERGLHPGRRHAVRLGLVAGSPSRTARSSSPRRANGENPLVHGGKPILGCDVWEHSYYIDYRNRRPDYLKAFMDHLVNWEHVAKMYDAAMK